MLPHDPGWTDRQLFDYLLGRLPPPDAERLDEASVVDDDCAARLRVVEDDLVDAYARGTLDEDTRQRFESYYLASEVHRARARFAVEFLRAMDGCRASKTRYRLTHPGHPQVIAGTALVLAWPLRRILRVRTPHNQVGQFSRFPSCRRNLRAMRHRLARWREAMTNPRAGKAWTPVQRIRSILHCM